MLLYNLIKLKFTFYMVVSWDVKLCALVSAKRGVVVKVVVGITSANIISVD